MSFAIDTSALHPTTELGLEAIHWLQSRASCKNILDMGCGNGLLSLVAAEVWDARVTAADISPQAVADTQAAALEHGFGSQITVLRSDRFAHPAIREGGPYDLIIANLLAEWLKEMAVDIKNNVKPGGYVILCGMLEWLAEGTEASFATLGFEIVEKISLPPWQCSIVRHISAT